MRHLKIFVVSLLVLAVGVTLIGCGRAKEPKEKISLSGSTALLPLVNQAKNEYEKDNANVTVNVSGGGSFTGLKQVNENAVDVGNSDVEITDVAEFKNSGLVDHKVAIAPYVIIANPGVTVDSLTKEQLVDIFTGKITNWKEVGGEDLKISLIHRAPSSGSRAVVKDLVLEGKEFTNSAVIQDSNGSVRAAIAQTPGAIGYVDAAYIQNTIKVLKYNDVEYSPANVYDGKYPLYAYEHMYTKGEPKEAVKKFIDFVMGDEFQNAWVEKLGFLSISKMNK